jgi:UDP-2,3-diacylglucosamine hydrolase
MVDLPKTLHKIIFISDLHLQPEQPAITHAFLHLLNQIDTSVDALYILGDLFEVWIGDDYGLPHHHEIIQALKAASQKTPIYFLHGNRDFLIGKEFFKQTACQLLPDETKINVYGERVLLMHGDTLCTQDLAYMQARKKLRHPFIQKVFLLLPIALRKKIADSARKKSMQHTSSASYDSMDVVQAEVEQVMQKHQVNYLIHGHTHKPDFHEFSLQGKQFNRLVLGAWHDRGNMLVWESSGKKELKQL